MEKVDRPWGHYQVLLTEPSYQVKRIGVNPESALSYQRHFRRAEHWYMVEGEGVITLDGQEYTLTRGMSIDIAVKAAHRISNKTKYPLGFIEVQTGDYLEEDDIERIEDIYGRL